MGSLCETAGPRTKTRGCVGDRNRYITAVHCRTMLPQWIWCVRFRASEGGGETHVVAPHRAAAKQAIATPPERVTVYESTEPTTHVSDRLATQRFDGYYPGVRAAIAAIRGH